MRLDDVNPERIEYKPLMYSKYCRYRGHHQLDLRPPRQIRDEHQIGAKHYFRLMGLDNLNLLCCFGYDGDAVDFEKFLSRFALDCAEQPKYKVVNTPKKELRNEKWSHIIWDEGFEDDHPEELQVYLQNANMLAFYGEPGRDPKAVNLSLDPEGAPYYYFRINSFLSPFSQQYYCVQFLSRLHSRHQFEKSDDVILKNVVPTT